LTGIGNDEVLAKIGSKSGCLDVADVLKLRLLGANWCS